MEYPKEISLPVNSKDAGIRIDKFLHLHLPEYSRSYLQKLFAEKLVTTAGKEVKPSYKVAAGETVSLIIPPPQTTEIRPQNIPINIIYEDDDIVVLNKQPGMIVHPGAGVKNGTLVNALIYHIKDLSGIGGRLRPGIVHRLDKNTSGILVVAKNNVSQIGLSRQFQDKTAIRLYTALVWHHVKDLEGEIVTNLNRSKRDRKLFTVAETGKKAITKYRVIKYLQFLSLLNIQLLTGRTHQIRIHLNYIHHPVFGDPQYHGRLKQLSQLGCDTNKKFARELLSDMPRQALHATSLSFSHPVSGKYMEFSTHLPADLNSLLMKLERMGE